MVCSCSIQTSRRHINLPFFLFLPGKCQSERRFRNASMNYSNTLLAPRSRGSFCFWRRLSSNDLGEGMRDLYQWTSELQRTVRSSFCPPRPAALLTGQYPSSGLSPLSPLITHLPLPIIAVRSRDYRPRLDFILILSL